MLAKYINLIKVVGLILLIVMTARTSYDYGVTSTKLANRRAQDKLLDKLEQKQDEAFVLAVELAKQIPVIDIQYRTIEKEVIKYAQAHTDKQCVATDDDWLRIRANAVRAHNRAIGIQQPAPVPDDPTQTAGSAISYERDAEILAEDVFNLKVCTENAQKLQSLQNWIRAQL